MFRASLLANNCSWSAATETNAQVSNCTPKGAAPTFAPYKLTDLESSFRFVMQRSIFLGFRWNTEPTVQLILARYPLANASQSDPTFRRMVSVFSTSAVSASVEGVDRPYYLFWHAIFYIHNSASAALDILASVVTRSPRAA